MSAVSAIRQRFDVRHVVVAVCAVLGAIAVTRTGHSVESQDVRTYLEMTRGVATHGLPYLDNGPADRFAALRVPWNVFTGGHSWGIYGPLYAYYAAPFLLLGGLRLVSVATFALNVPIAIMTAALTRRLTARDDCAAASAIVVAFSTPIAAKSLEFTAYPLLALCAVAATLSTVLALDCPPKRRWAWSAAAGLLWAAAVLGHVLCFPMALASISALALFDVGDPAKRGAARLRRIGDVGDPAKRGAARLRRIGDVGDPAKRGAARLRRIGDVGDPAKRGAARLRRIGDVGDPAKRGAARLRRIGVLEDDEPPGEAFWRRTPLGWLRPTRTALASGAAATVALALGLLPLVGLNRARFGTNSPLSYGPVVWRGALPAGLLDMTVAGHLRDAFVVIAWASMTGAAFVAARALRRMRTAATLAVGLGSVIALALSHELREKVFVYGRTAIAFAVDMTMMPLDRAYHRAPGGFGFLYGPWTIKSTLQCTPVLLAVAALPFLRLEPRTRARVVVTLAPVVALYGYLTLRGNIELASALGYPWVYIRYTFPALPMLVGLSFVTVGRAPFTWRHAGVAAVIGLAVGSALLVDATDEPLYRRVLVLVVPLVVALGSLGCIVLGRFRLVPAGWIAMAISVACGVGVGVGTGHDLRANFQGKAYCDFRVDLMARLAPRRFAVFGALPSMETVLALRAERDIEYGDLGQLDDVREIRPLLQRWFDEERPVYLVVGSAADSPWPDVVYEVLDEHEHIYLVRPVERPPASAP